MRSATNINLDVILATECKEDAVQFCNDQNLYPEPGSVITCLRCQTPPPLQCHQDLGAVTRYPVGCRSSVACTVHCGSVRDQPWHADTVTAVRNPFP